MERVGIEPTTNGLKVRCYYQLSYRSILSLRLCRFEVEERGDRTHFRDQHPRMTASISQRHNLKNNKLAVPEGIDPSSSP